MSPGCVQDDARSARREKKLSKARRPRGRRPSSTRVARRSSPSCVALTRAFVARAHISSKRRRALSSGSGIAISSRRGADLRSTRLEARFSMDFVQRPLEGQSTASRATSPPGRGIAASRLRGIAASRPRRSLPEPTLSVDFSSRAHDPLPLIVPSYNPRGTRRRDSSPRNIHVAAAAAPRPVFGNPPRRDSTRRRRWAVRPRRRRRRRPSLPACRRRAPRPW